MLVGCCSGPGLVASWYGFISGYLLNIEDGADQPCWCISVPLRAAIGYDSDRDWLIVTTETFSSFQGIVPGQDPAVLYYDLRACDAIDGMTAQSLIDSATATAIFAGDAQPTTDPDSGTTVQSWVGVFKRSTDDDYRLYGATFWVTDATFSYTRIWSVKYDGSDFTEELLYHVDGSAVLAGPVTLSGDGDIVTANGTPDPATEVRVNGSVVATIDPPVSGVGAVLGGGFVFLSVFYGLIVGDDPTTDIAYFAFTKDGFTYQYSAINIGWSDKFGGLMTLWVGGSTDPLATPMPSLYVTLATATLSAGNILGQAGVTAYDFATAPGVKHPLYIQQEWCTFINFCTLPRPTEFEPAIITPTPPSCDDIYAGCTAPGPLQAVVTIAVDCFIAAGVEVFDDQRNGSIINGSWTMENATTLDPTNISCVSTGKTGFACLLIDLTASPFDGGTVEDQYAAIVAANAAVEPPITLPYRVHTQTETLKNEFWLRSTEAGAGCEDGYIYLTDFHVNCLRFDFVWSGDDEWVLSSVHAASCVEDFATIIHKYPGRLFPDCTTILQTDPPAIMGMVTLFAKDVCGVDSPDGLQVTGYFDLP